MFGLLKLFSVVTLIFVVVNAELFNKYKIVETTNGKIRGILNITLLNRIPFYAFKGIPYAKKPIGPLRFKVNICFLFDFYEFESSVNETYFIANFGQF